MLILYLLGIVCKNNELLENIDILKLMVVKIDIVFSLYYWVRIDRDFFIIDGDVVLE